jgi:hypothetical protein
MLTARPCGRFANHVDHVDPRRGRGDSALKPTGSTRRWRRIRALVLDRDGHRCQVLVALDGTVVDAPRPTSPPLGPDDPAWLRATCADHNLARGATIGDARPATGSPAADRPTRWEW